MVTAMATVNGTNGAERRVVLLAGATARTAETVLRRLVGAGFRVAAVARDEGKLRGMTEKVGGGESVLPVVADVLRTEEVERAVRDTLGACGRLDAMTTLVGAGFLQKPFAETQLEELRRMVEGNLYTTYVLCRAVLPHMLERGEGYVATVVGGSALDPGYGRSLFAASKGAIVALTKGIARDHKQQGIRANCLVAGTIATEAARRYLPPEDLSNAATMEEFADALVYLCSPGASGLSGAVVELNGREVD
jgi:NAD(P)-dependent dehydrogenase (short-subunit alcohol dehydrogenase family)